MLRNLNFVFMQTSTFSYCNSFLPSAIQLLNGLPLERRCIDLKNVLKKPVVERTKNLKIFYYGSSRGNIINCQLRNESSDLKAYLFNQRLCQSASYDNCVYTYEDNYHLSMPVLFINIHRLTLYDNVLVLKT